MLRIEKSGRKKLAKISINNRFSLLTPNFLLSFSLALGLHLLGASIFYIKSLKINYSNQIFSPVKVAVDISHQDGLVMVDFEEKSAYPIQELKDPIPEYINNKNIEFEKFIAYPKDEKKDRSINLLSSVDDYSNFLDPSLLPKKGKKPIEIQVSGELAELKFKKNFEGDKKILRRVKNTSMKAVFAVLVEGKSGAVFWKEKKKQLVDNKLQSLADKIVDSLEFELQEEDFVKSGIVEVEFTMS